MGYHMSHMPLFWGHLEGHIVEVNTAEVFLWQFVPSGRKRVKDAFIEFFWMKEREQVQDRQHKSLEMHTCKHILHTQTIHIYHAILDCNSGWQKVFDVWCEFTLHLRHENKSGSRKWTCHVGGRLSSNFVPPAPLSTRDENCWANLHVLSTHVPLRRIWWSHLKLQEAKTRQCSWLNVAWCQLSWDVPLIWKQTWI